MEGSQFPRRFLRVVVNFVLQEICLPVGQCCADTRDTFCFGLTHIERDCGFVFHVKDDLLSKADWGVVHSDYLLIVPRNDSEPFDCDGKHSSRAARSGFHAPSLRSCQLATARTAACVVCDGLDQFVLFVWIVRSPNAFAPNKKNELI